MTWRTAGQRRAEAMAAVFAGAGIACQCGSPECPTLTSPALAGSVVVHVVADEAAVVEAGTQSDVATDKPDIVSPACTADASMPGRRDDAGGVVPPTVGANDSQRCESGAVAHPRAQAEQQYRPSIALQRFIRCRDMTCRFPAVTPRPNTAISTTRSPCPVGPTHRRTCAAYAAKHHLLRTFWTGVDGWADRQSRRHDPVRRPDAPTSPPTEPLVSCPPGTATTQLGHCPGKPTSNRGLMMPWRHRTRA